MAIKYSNTKWLTLSLALWLTGCETTHIKIPTVVTPPVIAAPVATLPPPLQKPATTFTEGTWEMLPNWKTIDLAPAWPALLQSCRVLKSRHNWQEICSSAEAITNNVQMHAFYETWFTPYQVRNPDGSDQGLITGYYEPKLSGSRKKNARFHYPLYAVPDDMITIALGEQYPQLKDLRLRGRLTGRRIVPYYDRAQIDSGSTTKPFKALFWVDNALELFFLQVEGSGRIELPNGQLIKVGYADQNGHPYVSIGRKLVESGELKVEDATMQGIKLWAKNHPDKLQALLEQNPSYVFFRELTGKSPAALGALGVPLTEQYSLAVDARIIPLGLPVFLSSTYPDNNAPLNRLMLAQDTGGAINGAVRADFFWGYGDVAADQAGKMKQRGRMWVLFPKGGEPQ